MSSRGVAELPRLGQTFGPIRMPVSFKTVIFNVAATFDYFPGHHEPEYAHSQGVPNIFLNTIFLQGFADRAVTDWLGHDVFVLRRRLRMFQPICAGDTLVCAGAVEAVGTADDVSICRVGVSFSTEHVDRSAGATAWAWLPRPGQTFAEVEGRLAVLDAEEVCGRARS
jgi:acyl dehydratase